MAEEKLKVKIESSPGSAENKTENISSPDFGVENNIEKESSVDRNTESGKIISENGSERNNHISQSNPTPVKNARVKQLESILEKDLKDVYLKMSPNQRISFKQKGEEVSRKINVLMDEVKIKTKKILALIKDWLGMIPGVNRFFLEQLAKNKLDEIMNLKKK